MIAKQENQTSSKRPILFVDVDGVISLFGFSPEDPPPGSFHWVDGVLHCINEACGPRLRRLSERYELVWATGWEEKANEYLPHLLALESEFPVVSFDGGAVFGQAHWKLGALDTFARGRPAAWVDDFLDEECERWADERNEPTLLVRTESHTGLTDELVDLLLAWADSL
ncbi:MAG TPA: HAD domain-containing protein [Thermoleophilaceae bacterium]